MPEKLADAGGIVAILGGLIMNAWNMFTTDPINTSIVVFTGVGGAVYVFYKVRNERKKSKLLDLEIQNEEKKLNE